MKDRIVAIAASLAALLAVAVVLVPATFAQGQGNRNGAGNGQAPATAPAQAQQPYGRGMMGGGVGVMGSGNSLIAVAADKLGMTTADLVAALGGTKSIAQVASEHNVALDTIIDAFLAPRIENLNAAVAAGRITQAQADQMLATMRTNVTAQANQVWTSRGHGQGMGSGYVDADGDGVCDNMPAGGQGRMGRGRP